MNDEKVYITQCLKSDHLNITHYVMYVPRTLTTTAIEVDKTGLPRSFTAITRVYTGVEWWLRVAVLRRVVGLRVVVLGVVVGGLEGLFWGGWMGI